jgi:hypothetical protein
MKTIHMISTDRQNNPLSFSYALNQIHARVQAQRGFTEAFELK